jgi:hypothetical protein
MIPLLCIDSIDPDGLSARAVLPAIQSALQGNKLQISTALIAIKAVFSGIMGS